MGAGSIDGQPTGTACPMTGDSSSDPTCLPGNPSYDNSTGTCVAPVDAVCAKLASGSWGCYWPPVGCPGGVVDPTDMPTDKPTDMPTDKPTEKPAGQNPVSVCLDATCLPGNPSYDNSSSTCVAPVDAKCAKLSTGSWGCYWPPVGCPTLME